VLPTSHTGPARDLVRRAERRCKEDSPCGEKVSPPGRSSDPATLSAFDSFFRRAQEGSVPNLLDRNDLWQLLVLIAGRKVSRGQLDGACLDESIRPGPRVGVVRDQLPARFNEGDGGAGECMLPMRVSD